MLTLIAHHIKTEEVSDYWFYVFSSPEQSSSELMPWRSVRRPSTFSFKQLLL